MDLYKTFSPYFAELDVLVIPLDAEDPRTGSDVVFVHAPEFLASFNEQGELFVWVELCTRTKEWTPAVWDILTVAASPIGRKHSLSITDHLRIRDRPAKMSVQVEARSVPAATAATLTMTLHQITHRGGVWSFRDLHFPFVTAWERQYPSLERRMAAFVAQANGILRSSAKNA